MNLPEQVELLSLFECEPIMLDDNEQLPFFYNQVTYQYINFINERIVFTISPSCGQITIAVYDDNTEEIISSLEFNNVKSLDILSDKKKVARIMITSKSFVTKVDIKPRFRIFLSEPVDI